MVREPRFPVGRARVESRKVASTGPLPSTCGRVSGEKRWACEDPCQTTSVPKNGDESGSPTNRSASVAGRWRGGHSARCRRDRVPQGAVADVTDGVRANMSRRSQADLLTDEPDQGDSIRSRCPSASFTSMAPSRARPGAPSKMPGRPPRPPSPHPDQGRRREPGPPRPAASRRWWRFRVPSPLGRADSPAP
jgi:hypothetical protein